MLGEEDFVAAEISQSASTLRHDLPAAPAASAPEPEPKKDKKLKKADIVSDP